MMNRNRTSSRLARRQTKNSEKTADLVNGADSLSSNGQNFDDLDMLFGNCRSKFYPIYTPSQNKKVNTHNLAEIPSLQSDEDSIAGLDNISQNSEINERNLRIKLYGNRKNANSLIESLNKFRKLLSRKQTKKRSNGIKNESTFDGYELKSRRVKPFEPNKKLKKDDQTSPSKLSSNEYTTNIDGRMVDLTQFCKMNPNHQIPLYSICRVWCRSSYTLPENLKCKKNIQPAPLLECPDPDGPYSDGPVDVIHLPKPEPLPIDEDGNVIILRIPKKVRDLKKNPRIITDTSFIGSMEHLDRDGLLKLNMSSWKQSRSEFMDALRQNEKRYKHSFAVLRSIYDISSNHQDYHEISMYKNPPYENEQMDIPVQTNINNNVVVVAENQESTLINTNDSTIKPLVTIAYTKPINTITTTELNETNLIESTLPNISTTSSTSTLPPPTITADSSVKPMPMILDNVPDDK